MSTLHKELEARFHRAVEAIAPNLTERPQLEVAQSSNEKFGHYQCNAAMRLAPVLSKPPRQLADEIAQAIEKEGLEKVEIAGPGFINCTFSPTYLERSLEVMKNDPKLGAVMSKGERLVCEFSSPNVAKEMHVGHLRSTIIGDALARLFEFLGYDVLRLNHIGDWGTQFGMLITFMEEDHPEVVDGGKSATLPELMQWYRAAKMRFDADATFKERSQKAVVALQGGDPRSLAIWRMICSISRTAYQEIYDLLGVKLEERGESTYNPQLALIVKGLEEKGLIALSNGAKCVYMDGFTGREGDPLPLIVQKSDGGYNYATTDLAALRQRIEQERAKRLIYVTDLGQALHFQMFTEAAKLAGWWDPNTVEIDHVTFGLVLGPDGKKFRTRSGETERLLDLLLEAVERAREIVAKRGEDLTEQEIEAAAHVIGLGALKYADLSCSRTKDYQFSYDRMLRLEGNTAPFLLYAYVRVQGLKRKAGVKAGSKISLSHPSEISLALHLLRFADALEAVEKSLMPHRLTDYLYALAEKFHRFFTDCRVVGSDEEGARLALAEMTATVMKQGLHLLGIETLERM